MEEEQQMASFFTEEQTQEFANIFSMFDKDGDGTMSVRELGTVFRSLGQNPTPQELKTMIEEVDTDGSGEIEFDEFLQMMSRCLLENNMEKDLVDAFAVFDKSGNGNISVPELREILSTFGDPLPEEEITAMIRVADIEGTGVVNYLVFVKELSNPRPQRKVVAV